MLPLWIIDLSENKDNADRIFHALSKIEGTEELWHYCNISIGKDYEESIVKEGQTFIHKLNTAKSPLQGVFEVQVCVLGYAVENSTQKVFDDVSTLISREKYRILPTHVNYGMTVTGMLFIPSEAYMLSADKRQDIETLLETLQMRYDDRTVDDYHRMILWQDSQMTTERVYPLLDEQQCVEFLMQCLLHMYYITNAHMGLFGNEPDYFMSLGVAAVYYDVDMQDKSDRHELLTRIISTFIMQPRLKDDFKDGKEEIALEKFQMTNLVELTPEAAIGRMIAGMEIDFDGIQVDEPLLDPEEDFFNGHLHRLYYEDYLSNYTTELMEVVQTSVMDQSAEIVQNARKECREMKERFLVQSSHDIESLLQDAILDLGFLSRVESQYSTLDERIKRRRKSFEKKLSQDLNNRIESKLPEEQQESYHEYHQADSDGRSNASYKKNSGRAALMKEAFDRLVQILEYEPTVLSFICRTVILSVLVFMIFMVIPDIEGIAFIGALIPPVWLGLTYLSYKRQRRYWENRLRAFVTHETMARIVNIIEDDIAKYYEEIFQKITDQRKRFAEIRKALEAFRDPLDLHPLIPDSMFCQPVLGGRFAGEEVLPFDVPPYSIVIVDGKKKGVNELEDEDYQNLTRHFIYVFNKMFNPELTLDSDKNILELRQELEKIIMPRTVDTIELKMKHYLSQYPDFADRHDLMQSFCHFAAVNGNVVCNTDPEHAAVVTSGDTVRNMLCYQLPLDQHTDWHTECKGKLFNQYIFLTRWRTVKRFAINRIL